MLRMVSLVGLILCGFVANVNAAFDPCKFNFGMRWDEFSKTRYALEGLEPPKGLDYLLIWLAENTQTKTVTFQQYWQGAMAEYAKSTGLTQVYMGYAIAKLALVDAKLEDCDVANRTGAPSLCKGGADYIRNNRAKIISTYAAFAKSLASVRYAQSGNPAIFLMEPDYIQYSNSSQSGGGLSYEYLGTLMGDIISAMKAEYPQAKFSMDISPWINDPAPWYAKFDMTDFSYMNTSGGRTEGGNERIRLDNNNLVTWKQINQLTKKTIIADAGYGVGGSCDGSGGAWTQLSNIENRIKDGVVAYTHSCGTESWLNSLATLSTSIQGKPVCNEQSGFALTLSPGTGGTITTTPAGTSFPAGTSVQLTATPATGYRFVSWGGAASGTTNPTTVTMDAAKTVSATFAVKSAVKYTLTLSATTNGTISATPSGSIDSGATVTLVATPAVGYKLSAWTGAASGTSRQTTLVMNGEKTVGATFVVDNTPVTLAVGTAANGTVAVSPVMPSGGYARGTAVTLTATPASGFQLVSWGAAVGGNTNPLALKMDSNISVTPVFRKIGEVSNLIKGGDGSSTTNWTVYSNPAGAQLTVAADPKSASNSVLSTKGNYGERSGDTAFMVSQSGIQLVAGTTYYLSFRAMVSSPDDSRGPHPMGVRVVSGASSVFKVSDSVLQDTSWHEYTYSFRASASGSATLAFLLGNAGDRNWQSVLIDDIVLSDLPPVSVGPRNIVRKVGLRMVGNTLDFSLATQAGRMRVDAIAPSGEVRNLADLPVGSGVFRTSVSVADLRSGIYTLRIRNGQQIHTGTFSVVK